jgi:hypothetical protein
LFTKNPKYESAVFVASGTLGYNEALKGWKPERESYRKRKGPWWRMLVLRRKRSLKV